MNSRDGSPRSVANLMVLTGRVAVVTGGAGYIGRVVADALAEVGANVALVDQPGVDVQGLADEIATRRNTRVVGVSADLEDDASRSGIAYAVLDRLERIDILVHMAALVSAEPLPDWTVPFDQQGVDTWRRALEVNLTAVFAVTQSCLPALRESGNGSVITVGSTYGVVGPDWRIYDGTDMGNAAGYAASKGGVTQLTRWLATTLAPDVRVNCLTPGGVERGHPRGFVDAYTNRTPMQRMAREEDYKGAIVYLASDLSQYVTGHNLVVDGGWTAW